MVSAFISHKDFTLEFFDTQQIDALDPSLCFFTMDRNSLSLSKVAEFLNWPSSEAVYAEYTGYDLAEMHPSSLFADQLYNRWATAKVPGWHIIDRCAAGIINTVIAKKADRLSRNLLDFETLLKAFEAKGVDLISVQESFDTSTATGRGFMRMLLTFAQMEREQTSERTIDVMAYRAQQGMFNGGHLRLGYDIDADNKGLVPNESELPLVREVFATYVRLGSLSAAASDLNNRGYRLKKWTTSAGITRGGGPFQKNSVSRILNDPVYIGKVRHKENIYEGQHQAIVDEGLFATVQAMLQANTVTKTGYRQAEDNTFVLKGLVRCGSCRSGMSPTFSTSKGKKYFYYRCTVDNDKSQDPCEIGSVPARRLEEAVIKELKFLSEDTQVIERVVDKATKDQRAKAKELAAKRKTLADSLPQIDNKVRNLLEVLGEGGAKNTGGAVYIVQELTALRMQAEQLNAEIASIDDEINAIEKNTISAERIRDSFKHFRDVYDNLTTDEKYDLVHLLVKKVTYFEEKNVDNDGKKAGKIKMALWELPAIEPSDLSSTKSFAERNAWLPNPDSNQGHGG